LRLACNATIKQLGQLLFAACHLGVFIRQNGRGEHSESGSG